MTADRDHDLICELQKRIDDLLADNDEMRLECWWKGEALRIVVERLAELENPDAR